MPKAAAKFVFMLLFGSIAACMYWLYAPHAVQTLDCGELVTNSYLWRTLHPPGYPLYEIIYWLGMHVLPGSTLVAKASLVTLIFALGFLLLLFSQFLPKKFTIEHIALGGATCLLLLSWPPFWQYSLVPDVFMLHLFLVACFFSVYWHEGMDREKKLWLCGLIFALGVSLHHTIVFLLPLLLDVCIERVEKERNLASVRSVVVAGASSILLAVLLYGLLFTTDSSALTSWQELNKVSDLIDHFLRRQYDTFSLTQTHSDQIYPASIYRNFFREISFLFWLLIPVAFFFRPKLIPQRKTFVTFMSLAAYVVVFFLLASGMNAEERTDIHRRFVLMPAILILLMFARLARHSALRLPSLSPSIFFLALGIPIAVACQQIRANAIVDNYRTTTIIEKWAIDRLQDVPPSSKPTIVFSEADSTLFALYYAHDILGIRPDLIVLSRGLLQTDWYLRKIKRLIPDLNIDSLGTGELTEEFFKSNIQKFNFNVSEKTNDSKAYKITFLRVGRQVEEGQGIFFRDSPTNYEAPLLVQDPDEELEFLVARLAYDGTMRFYMQYAYYDLALGLQHYQKKDFDQARQQFEHALALVPFALPAQANLCTIAKEQRGADDPQCLLKMQALNIPLIEKVWNAR